MKPLPPVIQKADRYLGCALFFVIGFIGTLALFALVNSGN